MEKETKAMVVLSSPSSSASRITFIRYSTFLVSIAQCLCAGTLYGWGAYNKVIKDDIMFYSGSEINLINSMALVGQYMGFIPGFINDRWGPNVGTLYATTLCSLGYLLVYLQLSTKFVESSAMMCFFYLLIGQGSVSLYLPAIMANVRNFPSSVRGVIVGIVVSGFGLSGALFSAVYKSYYQPTKDVPTFLLMLAIVIAAVGVLGALCIRLLPLGSVTPSSSTNVIENVEERIESMASPLIEPEVVDIHGKALLRNKDWLMLFVVVIASCGTGLMFISNVSLMADSMHFSDDTTLLMVSLLSYGNCLSRLVIGVLSDQVKRYFSRCFFLVLALFIMTVSYIVLAMTQETFLVTGAILTGLSYGTVWAAAPTFVSEHFGLKAYASNWGMTTVGAGVGAFPLNAIAGAFFDAHKQTIGGANKCYGPECYRATYIISACVAGAGMVLAFVLARRVKKTHQWI
eukprot:GILK01004738.1.p1 GENE.GILK01004738.1~~GILK01004738.1.p1  ORF type:complete len:480 (+),score=62.30 GILK01004738.1:64-1440(+)